MVSLSGEDPFTYWEPHSPHARRIEARGTVVELLFPEKILMAFNIGYSAAMHCSAPLKFCANPWGCK